MGIKKGDPVCITGYGRYGVKGVVVRETEKSLYVQGLCGWGVFQILKNNPRGAITIKKDAPDE